MRRNQLHMLRYFVSWFAIILSTVTIIGLFLLLTVVLTKFDNPGGIYFYLYFVFPPLWLLLCFVFTVIAGIVVSFKKGVYEVVSTVSVNIFTGLLFGALILGGLYIYFNHLESLRQEKLIAVRKDIKIENVQWKIADAGANGEFHQLLG